MQENYNGSFLPKFSFDTKKTNTHIHTKKGKIYDGIQV